MYKIYINGTPLILIAKEKLGELPEPGPEELRARYPGKSKFLLHYIDMLEKSDRFARVVLYSEDFEGLKRDFDANFKLIEAAGGLVTNEQGQVLLIYRRGSWDLPKGKIDAGESPAEAALREVGEETGLREHVLGKPIATTYHTYRDRRGKRILKRTYWFAMHSPDEPLLPQAEEDIERAVWMDLTDFFAEERVIYGNIRQLLTATFAS